MGASEEAVVRRFYDEMNTGRKPEIAGELFTDDHVLHDPQVPAGTGPHAMAEAMAAYRQGGEGVWTIRDMFSAGDRVAVRWTGTGTHVGDINGIPATGAAIHVEAISIHRLRGERSPKPRRCGTRWASCSRSAWCRQADELPAGRAVDSEHFPARSSTVRSASDSASATASRRTVAG